MADRHRTFDTEEMATTSTAVTTVPPQLQEEPVEPVAVLTLRPTKKQQRKKVVWTEDTVDNEHMNKKKSKCCCIYEKPRRFGESDSEESDDECEHCFGHVEKKRTKHNTHVQENTEQPEPTTSVTLKPSEPALAPPDKPPSDT
ncbi:E3 ubiquitin-protein ligase PPP1R11-like [Pieris brassicae]|uniref:E3 ubiquitin-protein ligase PPP1R11-like n=1 Tax=Pieris brassicae TaxID=7116 RepID=UPI001E6627F0|nr:E3 ubiquitin-protein ligase PPP1R11-like [Pieris brassicae]